MPGTFFPLIFFPSGYFMHHLSNGEKTAIKKPGKTLPDACFTLGSLKATEKPTRGLALRGVHETDGYARAIPGTGMCTSVGSSFLAE